MQQLEKIVRFMVIEPYLVEVEMYAQQDRAWHGGRGDGLQAHDRASAAVWRCYLDSVGLFVAMCMVNLHQRDRALHCTVLGD